MPAMYPDIEFVRAGGLLFYGASLPDMYQHAAGHVHRILRGARAGDLPIEQATRFMLAVNARAAQALDPAIADMLLARADEVIE